MNRNIWLRWAVGLPALIASAVLMSSCISHNQIAGDWVLPSSLPDGVCPEISGRYANVGQSADSKRPAYLSCELLSSKRNSCVIAQAKNIDQVSIDKVDSGLRISAWSGGGVVESEILTADSEAYHCKDGWITIKNNTAKGYASSAAEFSSITRSFGVSQGHLLERKQTEGVLLILILPIPASTTFWYRYPLAGEGPTNSLPAPRP